MRIFHVVKPSYHHRPHSWKYWIVFQCDYTFFQKNICSIAGFTSLLACFKTPVYFDHFICIRNCEGKTRDTVTLYIPEQREYLSSIVKAWSWVPPCSEMPKQKSIGVTQCSSPNKMGRHLLKQFTAADKAIPMQCFQYTKQCHECWLEYTSFLNLQIYPISLGNF